MRGAGYRLRKDGGVAEPPPDPAAADAGLRRCAMARRPGGAPALFVYLRLRSDLDDDASTALRSRADDVAALVRGSGTGLGAGGGRWPSPATSFAQMLDARGPRRRREPGRGAPAARAGRAARRARRRRSWSSATCPSVEERRGCSPRPSGSGDGCVVVAGTRSRTATSRSRASRTSLLIGGPIALLLASAAGYRLAAAALRPVEAMRRRARRSRRAPAASGCRSRPRTTRSRRLGETLNEMLARLEASFERERTFVADASHELRTPLAVLKAELEARDARRPTDGAELREALAVGARGDRSPRPARRGPAGDRARRPTDAAGAAEQRRRRASCSSARATASRPRAASRAAASCRRRRRELELARPTRCALARRSATSSTTLCATAAATIALSARRETGGGARRERRGPRLPARVRPARLRAFHARRRCAHARRSGPGPGDRAGDRGGARRDRRDRERAGGATVRLRIPGAVPEPLSSVSQEYSGT